MLANAARHLTAGMNIYGSFRGSPFQATRRQQTKRALSLTSRPVSAVDSWSLRQLGRTLAGNRGKFGVKLLEHCHNFPTTMVVGVTMMAKIRRRQMSAQNTEYSLTVISQGAFFGGCETAKQELYLVLQKIHISLQMPGKFEHPANPPRVLRLLWWASLPLTKVSEIKETDNKK